MHEQRQHARRATDVKLWLQVDAEDVVSSEAYMMFYVRRPHPSESADATRSLKQ